MGQTYLGNTALNQVWLGNTQINTGTVAYSVPTSSLYARYDASNNASYPGTGTTWYDLSGNGNNLSYQVGDSITYSSAFGGIFNWSGGGTFYRAAGSTFNSGSQLSMMVWYRDYALTAQTQNVLMLFSNGTANLETRRDISSTFYGPYGYVYYNGIGIIDFDQTNRTSASYLNKWHFLAIVSSTTSTRMFFDGEYFYSPFSGSSLNMATTTPELAILDTSNFSGSVGEAAFYNRTLSNSEVYNYYNATAYRYQV